MSNIDVLVERACNLSGDELDRFLAGQSEETRHEIQRRLKKIVVTDTVGLPETYIPGGESDSLETTVPRPNEAVLEIVRLSSKPEKLGPRIPSRIGPYKILQQIGRGGMGQVFMAEQEEPVRRRVALKVINTDTPTDTILARFEAERQALAMMDHQNIAKVLDAGRAEDGRPYFAMELVKGLPMTEYCDKNRLSTNERLDLFVQTCRAIQHAHQKGIIHRDLKPSNVLVVLRDGKPMAKVIDFGLAKAMHEQIELTQKTLFTQYGQVVGTLEYMSPEQADFNAIDIDTRSDVYSLGVILYELLTGSTPIGRERLRSEAFDRILTMIREEEVPRPSARLSDSGDAISGISEKRNTNPQRLSLILKGDLDWIAIRSLEKDRARRYQGAAALAEDIERYLHDEPIEARPPSIAYRTQKAFRKHRLAILFSGAALLLLICGLIGTTSQWRRAVLAEVSARNDAATAGILAAREKDLRHTAERESQRAVNAEASLKQSVKKTEESLYLSQINLAAASWTNGHEVQLKRLLERAGSHESRGFEWYYLSRLARSELVRYDEHHRSVKAIAISPNGQLAASGDTAGELHVWESVTGKTVFRAKACEWELNSLSFSPNGKSLAVAGHLGALSVWDVDSAQKIRDFVGHQVQVFDVDFSPDGSRIASASADQTVRIWNVQTGEQEHVADGHRQMVLTVCYSLDGSQIASGGQDGALRVWNSKTGEQENVFAGKSGFVNEVAFSPDGQMIAAVHELPWGTDQTQSDLIIWNLKSGTEQCRLRPQHGSAHAVAFSPDSRFVSTGADDGTVHLINVAMQSSVLVHRGHTGRVWDLAFSKDGLRLLSCAADGTARIRYAFADPRSVALVPDNRGQGIKLAFMPETRQFALGDEHGAELRDRLTGERLRVFVDGNRGATGNVACLSVNKDGTRIAALSTHDQKVVTVWDVQSGDVVHQLTGHQGVVTDVAFSRNGDHLVTASQDRKVRVWSVETGELATTLEHASYPVMAVAFDPDGQFLVAATAEPISRRNPSDTKPRGELLVWEWRKGQAPRQFGTADIALNDLAFSPSSSQFASARADGLIEIWDANSGEQINSLPGHDGGTNVIQFFADGQRIVSGGVDRVVRVWDLRTAEQYLELRGHKRSIEAVDVSADGRQIISASVGLLQPGEVLLWDSDASSQTVSRQMQMTYRPTWSLRQLKHAAEEGNLYATRWHAAKLDEKERENARNALEVARAFAKLDHLNEAEQWCRRAIERDESEADAYRFLGDLLGRLGKTSEEIAALQQCAAIRTKDSELQYHIGNLQREIGDLEGAAASFLEASNLDPEYAEAFCNRGQLLVRLGRFDEAIEALTAGHQLGSERGKPKAGVQKVRARWKYPSEEWLAEAKSLLALDGELDNYLNGSIQTDDPMQYYLLARLCYIRGRDSDISRLSEKVDDLTQPEHPNAIRSRVFLVRSLLRAASKAEGDASRELRNEAMVMLKRIIGLAKDSGNAAMLAFVASEVNAATECQMLKMDPSNLDIDEQQEWQELWSKME